MHGLGRRLATLGLLLAACAGARAGEWQYRVRRGENLWTIVAANLTGPQWLGPLQRLNRVADPRVLPPGSELRIPLAWTRRTLASATVASTSGSVRAGGNTLLQAQAPVRSGEVIRTGNDGQVTLRFPDGSTMRIYPQSEVAIEQVEILGQSAQLVARVNVRRGYTESVVRPGSVIRRSDVQVASPYAITAVRGTHFRVNAEPDASRGSTGVLEGKVTVSPVRGRTIAVAGGAGTAVGPEGAQPVRALLPAPQLLTQSRIEQLPAQVALNPVEGAAGYSGDLSTDPEHEHIVASARSTGPALVFTDAPDGPLWLRARAVDAQGVEGSDAGAELELDARPEPPLLMRPAADALVAGGAVEFAWARRPDAARYDFEIYRADAQGRPQGTPLQQRSVREPKLTLQLPAVTEPQPQVWRVRVHTRAEGQGPFSQASAFRLVPAGPGIEPPGFKGRSLQLGWPRQPNAVRWKVEIAKDAGFAQPCKQVEVSEPRLQMERPPAGTWNVRIAWMDASGQQGPWSATQQFEVPRRKPWWLAGLLLIPLL